MAEDQHAWRLDRAIDAVVAFAMVSLAWLAVFGHRGAAVVAAIMALAIASRPEIWREGLTLLAPRRVRLQPLPRAAVAMMLFTLWIALSGLWSPTPGAPKLALTIGVFTLCGGALVYEASRATPARVRRMAQLFAGAVGAASLALLFEGLTGGLLRDLVPPTDQSLLRWKDMTALARGVTLVTPLVFPACALLFMLTGSRLVAAVPPVAAVIAASQFSVAANVVALLFGGAAFAAAMIRPKSSVIALCALFMATLFAAPLLAFAPAQAVIGAGDPVMPPSWAQRLYLYQAAGDRILGECLPFGCGADYARAWAAEGALIEVPGSPIPLQEAPTHPHNVFLQIWLELGLVGVLTFAAALWFGLQRIVAIAPNRLAFAALAAAGAACYISFIFEASLWQAWRIAVIALAAFGGALSYSFNGRRCT